MSVYYVQTSLTGLAIILLIAVNMRKHFGNKDPGEHIFSTMLLVTALLLIFELLLNLSTGKDSDTSRGILTFIVMVFYILNPFSGALWLLYVLNFTRTVKNLTPSLLAMVGIPLFLNTLFSVVSVFGNFTFYVDPYNVYHRGDYFALMPATAYVYLIASAVVVIRKRASLSRKEFLALMMFVFPNFLGALLQIVFYGIAVVWVMTAFALLIIYLYLQSEIIENNRVEQKYQELFLKSKTVQLVIDPAKGNIDNANPAAMAYYGLSLAALKEKHIDDLSTTTHAFADYLKDPMDRIYLDRQVVSGGNLREVEVYPAVFNQDGQDLVHMIIVDVTERLHSEQKMAEAKRIAEEANAAKSVFLATMSHEIRTPLNGIAGSAQLLLATDLTEAQVRYAATIKESSNLLLNITNDILDLAKIEAHKVTLLHDPLVIDDLVRQVSKIVRSNFKHKSLAYEVEILDEFPTFSGDRIRLSQILLNLLSNAFKFTDRGRVVLTVRRLRDEAGRSEVSFEVRDTGIGIKAEDTVKLFHKFTQIENSTTRRFEGTGLGLAIAKRLVELMGGTINLESREGLGSRFWFTVWLDKVPKDDPFDLGDPTDPAFYDGTRDLALSSPQPLLLVEDNVTINQLVATELLEKMGLEVHTAENGQQALEACQHHRYALILMDCHMPVMDGYQASMAIRQLEKEGGRRTPILAMTADAMEENKAACKAAGMDACLTKPIDRFELYASLKYWLEKGVHYV